MVSRSTSAVRTSAATKFWSFSRKAQSLATQRSFLVEAPAGELGLAIRRRGVSVLDLDEPAAPASGQGRGAEVDAVDAEAVDLLKRGELPGNAFNEVRESLSLGVVVGDGENVDL